MQLLSHLVWFQKDSLSKIDPDLAESWQLGADGKSYTFRLRKDVRWHDGTPFTSADVLYNFKRASDPRYTFNAQRVAPIATMETPDPVTFRVTLKDVSASFLANIAGPFMLMYPGHITDMAQWQKQPVGTGPFAFKEYNKDTSYVYRKNAGYYGKDPGGRALPYLDGIDWRAIVDPGLGLAAFRAGRLDCGCGYDHDFLTPAVDQLKKEVPGFNYGIFYSLPYQVMFNLQKPPFNNASFRQAIAIGLDKDQVAEAFIGGTVRRGGLNYTPVPPLFPPELGGQWGLPKAELEKIPGYNPNHAADIAIARQKLRESGIDPSRTSLELTVGSFASFIPPHGGGSRCPGDRSGPQD